jgi:hypothetical protein
MYVGLVADGTLLPPVIITSDPQIPLGIIDGFDAKIVILPSVRGPSADTTLRWLEEVKDYISPNSIIIHDNGPEFSNQKFNEELVEYNIVHKAIPPWGCIDCKSL